MIGAALRPVEKRRRVAAQDVRSPERSENRAPARIDLWLALALAALAIAVRAPGIERPLVGPFATKNAVYGMIARNFARGLAPVHLPTVDLISGDTPAWHLLEVPLPAYLVGGLWHTVGGRLDIWARGAAIVASGASAAWLFAALRRSQSRRVAGFAALAMAVSPVSIAYGRSFLLEPWIALLSIAAIDGFAAWPATGRRRWLVVGMAAMTAAALIKIYLVTLALPILVSTRGRRRLAALALCACFAPAVSWCAFVWRISAAESPEAARIYYSLRESRAAHAWPSPLLAEPSFYLGAARDLATVALTPLGAALAAVGLAAIALRRRRLSPQWLAWLLSAALLVVLLPAKFAGMNYYWLAILPPLAVLSGVGCDCLVAGRRWPVAWQTAAGALLVVGGVAIAAPRVWSTPIEDRSVVAAAEAARKHVPRGHRLIASHGTCPDLLYYCDRAGWALSAESANFASRAAESVDRGATTLVWAGTPGSLAPSQVQERLASARVSSRVLESGEGYFVLSLSRR